MPERRGTLDALVVPVSQAIAGVGDLLAVNNGADLMAELGYRVPEGGDLGALFADVGNRAAALTQSLTAVLDAYDDGSFDQPSFLIKVLDLGRSVVDVVETAQNLPNRANAAFAGAADFLNDGQVDQLPRRLVDYLVLRHLHDEFPALASFFKLLGLTGQTFVPEGDHNPDFFLLEIRWERFPALISGPGAIFAQEYGWGTADFAASLFIERLKGFLWLVGLPSTTLADAAHPEVPESAQLDVPLFRGAVGTPADGLVGAIFGLRLRRADGGADPTDAGLALVPYADGRFDLSIDLTEGWTLSADASIGAEGFSITVRPHSGVQVNAAAAVSGSLGVTLLRDGAVLGALVVFGNSDGTRLQVGEVSQRLIASVSGGSSDVGVELGFKDIALVLVASEGDGFLKSVLPAESLTIRFDLTVGISAGRGVYVSGGAGLEYTFHLNAEVGPIFVNTIDLSLRADAAGTGLLLTATGGLALGPLVAVVRGIGIEAQVRTDGPGNLGSASLALSFRPPTGIGLSLDTPTVKAGGFLAIDTEHRRYVGTVELSVLDTFDLTAIGIITTRLPDGSEGFSLLLVISTTFPAPIPIGFNFYLAGVGGLLGLSRSVDLDRLRDGVRAGTTDSILFPTDVVRRIDALVRDLEEVFPPVRGQFVVGPMALIVWSAPPLITAKLGLIIEIGSPVRVAILGLLRVALPDEDDPVVDLKVAFLGTIDVEAGLLTFDASIYDSYIGRGGFKLFFEGDIALRVSWGRHNDFVTSVGGFHPAFKPETYLKLPPLRRITLSLLKDNPRLTLTTYFAITTNTVQFGARLTFYFAVSEFSVVGDFGFDVLFQFSPFHIDARVWALLAVRWDEEDILSLSLDFRLQGPTPWIATGSARFAILFFSVSVRFEARFGEEVQQTLPEVEVLPQVLEELGRDANWRGELGRGVSSLVTLTPAAPTAGSILIDASGRLTVSQRILPLDTAFTLFGNSRPSDVQRVGVREMRLGARVATTARVFDSFAPAAFRELSDERKLKAPAYEPRTSGVRVTGGQELCTDYVLNHPVAYEMLISDAAVGAPVSRQPAHPEPQARFEALVSGGAAGRSPLARARARVREEGSVLSVGRARERFAVAEVKDLRPIGPDGRPATPIGADASGRPVYAPDVLLARTDAEARLAALEAERRSPGALEVIPEAQLAA